MNVRIADTCEQYCIILFYLLLVVVIHSRKMCLALSVSSRPSSALVSETTQFCEKKYYDFTINFLQPNLRLLVLRFMYDLTMAM